MMTEQITQRQAIANGVPPQTLNNAIANTGAVDMEQSYRAFFTLYIGAITGSISAWLQESADNVTWTANKTAGSFSQSGGNNVSQTGLTTANQIVTFEVRQDQLTPGKRYVRLQIAEVASSNALVAVVAEGDEGKHKPNNANNGTQVVIPQNVVS
jgi:hypothetical protein